MTHSALRSEFEQLIDVYAPVGQLGTGFTFTEGPIWHPVDHYLLFSDMPADVRRRWDARGGVREVRRPSNKHNGMTYDADLNLIVCEHATSSLVRERAGRAARGAGDAFRRAGAQLAERRLRALRRLDLFLRPVVRPHAGLRRGAPAPARLPGRLSRAAGRRRSRSFWSTAPASISRTGSASRPTRRLLYVNDTVKCMIWAFDVNAGRLALARAACSRAASARSSSRACPTA